jgi:hypothetical protein
LKILGRAEVVEGPGAAELISRLQRPGYPAKIERAIRIGIEAFDWNCQQHIPQRYTVEQVEQALKPMRNRIAELERENQSLREESELR